MNANEVMVDSAMKIEAVGIENSEKLRGFNSTATLIREMVKVKDSVEFLPIAIKKAYETYNHAEDLKDDDKDYSYTEGEYEAWEAFNSNFNKWLVDQDPHTIIKHSVNEEVSIKDGVKRPSVDTVEKQIMLTFTQFYIRGYDESEGKVTHVDIEVGEQKRKFSFEEFSSLFDHEQLYYMKK